MDFQMKKIKKFLRVNALAFNINYNDIIFNDFKLY